MHLSWERSSVRHLLSSDGAGWLSVVGSVSRTVSVHRAHAVRCRTPVLLVVLTGLRRASAGSSLCADFVIGGSNGHLQLVICGEYISLKSRMRAPNSDLKGHVLDDLALGRGGRLFKMGWKLGHTRVREGSFNTKYRFSRLRGAGRWPGADGLTDSLSALNTKQSLPN